MDLTITARDTEIPSKNIFGWKIPLGEMWFVTMGIIPWTELHPGPKIKENYISILEIRSGLKNKIEMQHLCRTWSPKCASFIFLNKPAAEPGQNLQPGSAWQPHILPWLLLCPAPAASTEILPVERCKTCCFLRMDFCFFVVKNEPFILPSVYSSML